METSDKKRLRLIQDMRAKGSTLQQIGDVFGISRERVRQLLDPHYVAKRNALFKSVHNSLDRKKK